jgi:hypothetical protein
MFARHTVNVRLWRFRYSPRTNLPYINHGTYVIQTLTTFHIFKEADGIWLRWETGWFCTPIFMLRVCAALFNKSYMTGKWARTEERMLILLWIKTLVLSSYTKYVDYREVKFSCATENVHCFITPIDLLLITLLITPSRNFVEAWWWFLLRSTSLGNRCTSYNAPSTSRKRKLSNKVSTWIFQTALVIAPPS